MRGWNQDILVLIEDETKTGSFEWRIKASLNFNKPYHSAPAIYGLEAYISDSQELIAVGMVGDVYIRQPTSTKSGVVIECNRMIAKGFAYPSCTEEITFHGVLARISFSVDLLSQWETITDDFLAFLDTCKVKDR